MIDANKRVRPRVSGNSIVFTLNPLKIKSGEIEMHKEYDVYCEEAKE